MLFKRKKCGLCRTNLLPKNPFVVKMKHLDGTTKLKVCEECADHLDIINNRVQEIRNG